MTSKTLNTQILDVSDLLLVVEDNEEDYEMFQRSLKRSNIECKIHRCETGDDALRYLGNQGEYQDAQKFRKPSLILLDLNLPGIDGHTVLRTVKLDACLKLIPVVIFSSSSSPQDLEMCYHNGANGYVVKPMEISRLQESIQLLLKYWLYINRNCCYLLNAGNPKGLKNTEVNQG